MELKDDAEEPEPALKSLKSLHSPNSSLPPSSKTFALLARALRCGVLRSLCFLYLLPVAPHACATCSYAYSLALMSSAPMRCIRIAIVSWNCKIIFFRCTKEGAGTSNTGITGPKTLLCLHHFVNFCWGRVRCFPNTIISNTQVRVRRILQPDVKLS